MNPGLARQEIGHQNLKFVAGAIEVVPSNKAGQCLPIVFQDKTSTYIVQQRLLGLQLRQYRCTNIMLEMHEFRRTYLTERLQRKQMLLPVHSMSCSWCRSPKRCQRCWRRSQIENPLLPATARLEPSRLIATSCKLNIRRRRGMKQQQQANKSYAGSSKQTKKGNLFLVTNLHAMASYLEGTCPELEGDST